MGYPLGNSTVERVCSQSNDQCWKPEPGNHQRIEYAACASHQQRDKYRQGNWKMATLPYKAKHHRSKANRRAHRKIDAAGDKDRRKRN